MVQPNLRPPGVALVLGVGLLAVSAAAILIRLAMRAAGPEASATGLPFVLAAGRLGLAALLVVPAWRGLPAERPPRPALLLAALAGVALAVHFASFIASFAFTSIAASMTLVTTNPIWIVLAVWLFQGDRPRPRTVVGIAVAIGGGAVIAFGDAVAPFAGSDPLLGDALALLGAWSFSAYLLLVREVQRRGLRLRHALAIVYTVAAVVVLPLPWAVGSGYAGWPTTVWLCVVGLALGPQLVGHSAINWAVGWLGATTVSLAVLSEPLLSTLGGTLVFGERPGPLVGVGALVLLSGVAVAVRGEASAAPSDPARSR